MILSKINLKALAFAFIKSPHVKIIAITFTAVLFILSLLQNKYVSDFFANNNECILIIALFTLPFCLVLGKATGCKWIIYLLSGASFLGVLWYIWNVIADETDEKYFYARRIGVSLADKND